MKKAIRIDERDNVAVALETLKRGDEIMIDNQVITIKEEIPFGHKVCIQPIADLVIKYGFEIGTLSKKVEVGGLINEHNLKSNLVHKKEWSYQAIHNQEFTDLGKQMEIYGYERANGDFGIRNDIWVIPSVGCINKTVEYYVKDYDVHLLSHPYGCSQSGDDGVNTLKALSMLAKHPNAGGVLIVGLGCENTQISMLQAEIGEHERIRYITLQDEEDEAQAIREAIEELTILTQQDQRTKIDPSRLKIGVECGGSDALSGITANPLVGQLSEHHVNTEGGSVVITEIPEFFGAEQCALNVCSNEQVYHKLSQLFVDYRNYYIDNKIEVYANPSPGNKKGGISTLEEKSLGCVNKIGKLPIIDVKAYAERVEQTGVSVISSPGNDLVATTALGLSGCHLVLFTTGRGTPFGGFVPTIKISTNTDLYNKKQNWIDFNAGQLLTENSNQVLEDLFDYVEAVCNGQLAKHEEIANYDIAIFKTGVTL